MLVDVAINALSPAINDPTTAVQSLDRIEDLLRYAASKHLSTGTVTDKHGAVRLMYPTPTWQDLIELAPGRDPCLRRQGPRHGGQNWQLWPGSLLADPASATASDWAI